MEAIGPRLPRSDCTEMGPVTEEHWPHINEPADSRRGPSLTQLRHKLD
jgi:hypothetical protein